MNILGPVGSSPAAVWTPQLPPPPPTSLQSFFQLTCWALPRGPRVLENLLRPGSTVCVGVNGREPRPPLPVPPLPPHVVLTLLMDVPALDTGLLDRLLRPGPAPPHCTAATTPTGAMGSPTDFRQVFRAASEDLATISQPKDGHSAGFEKWKH